MKKRLLIENDIPEMEDFQKILLLNKRKLSPDDVEFISSKYEIDLDKVQIKPDGLLFDFEDISQIELVKPQDASFDLRDSLDNKFIQVNNGYTIKETGVKLLCPEGKPWDLSGYFQIKAEVANVGDEDIQVELFVASV